MDRMNRLSPSSPVSLLEIILAVGAVVVICSLGCSTPGQARRLASSVFRAERLTASPAPARAPRSAGRHASSHDEGAALVVRGLHQAGLRFGTDGSTGALWGYMRTAHQLVRPDQARPGDVLFFDTHGRQGQERACADHAGVVEAVSGDGRITFIEARGGQIHESYVDPALPVARRGQAGQILNSFLRPKKISDPDGTRYFAGEMLCAVARPRLP
jgi:hypothetical protein